MLLVCVMEDLQLPKRIFAYGEEPVDKFFILNTSRRGLNP